MALQTKTILRVFAAVWLALLLPTIGMAQQPTLTDTDLQTTLQHFVDANGISGLSIAVVVAGSTTEAAAGVAVFGEEIALTPEDLLYAGSVTKTFVAATVLQLVDKGALALDTTLDNFYPNYPNADEITVEHMLSMTSGTFDYFRNAPENPFIPVLMTDINYLWAPDEIIDTAGSIAQPGAPGAAYTYSNTDYILLGRIIERTTGNPLHEELHKRIFESLGMETTYIAGSDAVRIPVAAGYVRDSAFLFGAAEPTAQSSDAYAGLETLSWAAGGMLSTPRDLAVGMRNLLRGDLISLSSLEAMTTPGAVVGEHGESYGYGIEFYETAAGVALGHAGSLPGYASLTLYIPDADISISVMTNDEAGEALLTEIVDTVLEDFAG